MTDKIRAPWTGEQVHALNRFQSESGMHPFTCGNNHPVSAILTATTNGWRCHIPGCDYRQDWAHAFMANPDTWPKPLPFASVINPQTGIGMATGGNMPRTGLLEAALAAQLGRPLYDAINKHLADGQEAEDRLRVADATARHWHQAALDRNDIPMAHAIACIGAALAGETDPGQLGWPESAPDTTAPLAVHSCGQEPHTRDCVTTLVHTPSEAAAAQATDGWEQLDNGTPRLGLTLQHFTLTTTAPADFIINACSPSNAADEPVTITDPAWLREQYATAIEESGIESIITCGNIADAVLAVRDRHLEQLRQRLALADENHQQQIDGMERVVRRARRAEQQRDQLAAVLREVLAEFVHETHPGRRCLQSGHVPIATVDRWRAIAYPPKEPADA